MNVNDNNYWKLKRPSVGLIIDMHMGETIQTMILASGKQLLPMDCLGELTFLPNRWKLIASKTFFPCWLKSAFYHKQWQNKYKTQFKSYSFECTFLPKRRVPREEGDGN